MRVSVIQKRNVKERGERVCTVDREKEKYGLNLDFEIIIIITYPLRSFQW